jgi:cyclopropane fatty-acyl-phospholipid synthase-like methyltransferase
VFVCVCVCVHAYTYIHTYIHAYICTHTHTNTHQYARAKVKELGFEDRISILFCDYRKIPKEMEGTFDRLVSICVQRVSNECLTCV